MKPLVSLYVFFLLVFCISVAAYDVAESTNVIETTNNITLASSTPLPFVSGGTPSVCLARPAFYKLNSDWTITMTFTPNTWPSAATLASATNQWSLVTSGNTLRFLVPRSPTGKSGYNHQWMLGVQNRLVGSPHTITISNKAAGNHTETWVFLDGELRAQLFDENLQTNPGSTGKLCIGTTWPMTVHRVTVQNGTALRTPTQYSAPQNYTIYPGRVQLAPVPIDSARPIFINSTVTTPSVGTRAYLEPRYLLANGELTKPGPKNVASFVMMACGVSGTKRNDTFFDQGATAFHDANQTFTCVISDSSFNKTATDTLYDWGNDLGLEYDITKCAGLGTARQNWLINRGHPAESFVNYFGITNEAGLQCAAKYGFSFLNILGSVDTDNPHYFRTTMRHAQCDYKTDVLGCIIGALKTGQANNYWPIVSAHWTGKYYNDTLWDQVLGEAGKLGINFQSVADVQHTYWPALGQPITLTPPAGAVAFVPTLYLYSDGTTAPTVTTFDVWQGAP